MPFVLRTTETPSLNRLLELEQIVIVDKTGPAIPLGVGAGLSALIGETLKGPFTFQEAVSTADILGTWGGVSNILSQGLTGIQDGSGVRYEGNVAVHLLGQKFQRLGIQRVDTDMTTTDAGTTKAFVKFTLYIHANDADPLVATQTGKDITIPAGTRFGDAALGVGTAFVALSQDIVIPRGTTIDVSSPPGGYVGRVVVNQSTTNQNTAASTLTGATAFFISGTTLGSGALDTVIDVALPNVLSIIGAVGGDAPSSINSAGAATAIFAAGTAAAALSAKIESLYAAAIAKTVPVDDNTVDINVVWSARRGASSPVIRGPLCDNATDSSTSGRGRIALVSGPRVGTASGDAATTTAAKTEVMSTTTTESPGRGDRKIVTFPYVQVYSSALAKNIVVAPTGFMANTLSNFADETNPGASNPGIQSIQAMEPAFQAAPFVRQDFVNFKSKGVACLVKDRTVGWWFQSGVTSVDPLVEPTRAPIKRRRMADFIQDTISAIGAPYNKAAATQDRVDLMVGEIDSFLIQLKSPPNPSNKRIEDYVVDPTSGNTPNLVALGVYTVIVKVRLLASLDTLVFETTIGETVNVDQ